ncbi:unnamed protein product [Pleuronectes platessa]|uniref:Uncharacterized protein n=1 Tax=Pleuronectes platessa TaxID=8262 RepID=A0A9N7VZP5_PLEPL|nr:unnamed protein product [Pleuronectes platessa]
MRHNRRICAITTNLLCVIDLEKLCPHEEEEEEVAVVAIVAVQPPAPVSAQALSHINTSGAMHRRETDPRPVRLTVTARIPRAHTHPVRLLHSSPPSCSVRVHSSGERSLFSLFWDSLDIAAQMGFTPARCTLHPACGSGGAPLERTHAQHEEGRAG